MLALNYGPTPQAAALSFFRESPAGSVTVVKTNVVGSFATVRVRGGRVEGELLDAPILFERFPFGWQAVEIANFTCRIRSRHITAAQADALMSGMPAVRKERCVGNDFDVDVGPPSAVTELRRRERARLIPFVHVAGNFARVDWYGGGGGEHYYKRDANGWRFIAGGGGAYSVSDMPKLGIPRTAWCTLGISGAICR